MSSQIVEVGVNRTELWRVWTTEETLKKRPKFGASSGGGWFYGLVLDEGELHLAEIFPGYGWAHISFGELDGQNRDWALLDRALRPTTTSPPPPDRFFLWPSSPRKISRYSTLC